MVPFVWSVRTTLKIGIDTRVTIGTQRLRPEKPPRTKVVLCLHLNAHFSVLASPPAKNTVPLHRSAKVKLSCFENYATGPRVMLALNTSLWLNCCVSWFAASKASVSVL